MPFGMVVALVGGLVARQPDFGTAMVIVAMAAALFFVAGADLLQLILGGVGGGVHLLASAVQLAGQDGALHLLVGSLPGRLRGRHLPDVPGAHRPGIRRRRRPRAWAPAGKSSFGCPPPRMMPSSPSLARSWACSGPWSSWCCSASSSTADTASRSTAPDRFGGLLAAGVTCWITVQALVNLGGITASLPLTGVPLPFISAGGSSLLTCMAGVGLMLSVSQHTVPEKKTNRAPDTDRWWNRWTRLPGLGGRREPGRPAR